MKHNRSLKELYLSKLQSKEQQSSTSIFSPRENQPSSSTASSIKSSETNLLKHTKNTHSQKNLFQLSQLHAFGSPKYAVPETDRCMTARNILTPANKNLSSQEQPKKPRILSKVRHSASFNEEFKMGKVLGKGRFGNVCMAMHNATGSIFAVKQISLEKVTPKLIERLIA